MQAYKAFFTDLKSGDVDNLKEKRAKCLLLQINLSFACSREVKEE